MQVPDLVQQLVYHGIDVTITTSYGRIVYDLNSHTKSWMHLIERSDGQCVVEGRYGERDIVEDFDDLMMVFISRYRDRDFGDQRWVQVAFDKLKNAKIDFDN